jgi:hypothetical protein
MSCWREKLPAPKLRISALMKAFAVSFGQISISIIAPHIFNESGSEDSIKSPSIESPSIELTTEGRS